MKIQVDFDCTQRGLVNDIARIIYATHGHRLPDDPFYLENSRHPTESAVLSAAESIYAMFEGDTPDYSDDKIN